MGKSVHKKSNRLFTVVSYLLSFFTDTVKRRFASALFGLLFSAALLAMSCVSIAWFAQNMSVAASGMSVSVAVSPELVIAGDIESLTNGNINDLNDGNPYAITQTSTVTKFYPVTHDDDYEIYENGLKTIKDEYTFAIDYNTGIGEDIEYVSVGNPISDTERHYYVDYTVYIAAHLSQLDGVAVKLTIASTSESDCHKAASVDVYRNSASEENYIGTLNVAGIDSAANRFPLQGDYAGTALTELYVWGSAEAGASVPLRAEGHLTYVLRFYFDGALMKSATQTFVHSAELDCSEVPLSVSFTAEKIG